MTTLSDQKRREEAKRERMWDARQRWTVIQATITWAEAQRTVQRNVPANRLAEQARKLNQISQPSRKDG